MASFRPTGLPDHPSEIGTTDPVGGLTGDNKGDAGYGDKFWVWCSLPSSFEAGLRPAPQDEFVFGGFLVVSVPI